MTGLFGGYAGYITPYPNLRSYQIGASVDGKAATQIKMVVYAPGCRIERFDLSLTETADRQEEFRCQTLPSVTLSGQIVPSDLVQDPNAELVVTYTAFWANHFFGITDGAVPQIRVATVVPEANGMFQVNLPDFSADPNIPSSQQDADLRLHLRDSKTWNPIAAGLEPELPAFGSIDHALQILPSYPRGLKFTAGPF